MADTAKPENTTKAPLPMPPLPQKASAEAPWSAIAPMQANPIQLAQSLLWSFIASQESEKLSLDPKDKGNWTSGRVGIGQLKGSKYGVSAANHPQIDIAAVTYNQAMQICMTEYWPAIQGDMIANLGSPALAMVMTDAAWGSGPETAVMVLQRTLGITEDGDFGQQTKASLTRGLAASALWSLSSGEACLIADYLAERVVMESQLGTWDDYEGGWTRRLSRIGFLVQPLLKQSPL